MVQSLAQEGIDVQTETSDCVIAATDKLAAAVAAGQALGLLWTRHTAAGLCLANRHAGVRAVLATSVSATAAAVAAVGANVLIVDPAVGTAYEKKQILRDFCLRRNSRMSRKTSLVLSKDWTILEVLSLRTEY